MGARQSRRSVDITTTPKKEGLPAEGVVGDAAAPGDGKLEKIEEADAKPTTNGVALHTDATPEDKEKDKDEDTEKEKEKEDAPKVEEPKVESPTTETPAEGAAEVTTPTEGTPASPTATSPDSKETKKKDKPKKKWSFRSISFGRKDKNKPIREDAPKNGDVAKETLVEGGEEAELVHDQSAVSSPTEKEQNEAVSEPPAAATEAKAEEDKSTAAAVAAPAVAAVAASPAEEKKEEPSTPAPTPVPVEAKKVEEIEKEVGPANAADKIVEVSPVQAVIEAPVEVNSHSKPIATTTAPSIIERKTSEDFPSQFPSSPPPTPIDPSPLQQAQQVAANASAIAEALKLPAEAANKANIANASGQPVSTALSTSPTSSWRVETSSTTAATLVTEHPSNPPTSEFPEHTGNASPIPVTITTTTTTAIAAVTGTTEKPSLEPQKSDVQITEVVVTSDAAQSEDIVASIATEILDKENNTKNEVEIVTKEIVDTIDIANSNVNDLVILTEEGPIPVYCDIVAEAKPAIVVSDSPIEDIEPVKVLMEVDNNRGNEEFVPEHVESTEGSIALDNQKSEILRTHGESVAPVIEARNEEDSEKDVPPPLPASLVPVPKATSQLLNFMSTQIEDSPVIAEIIDSSKHVMLMAEDISCPLPPPVVNLLEAKEQVEFAEESQSLKDTSCSLPAPVEIPDSRLEKLVTPAEDNDLSLASEELYCQSLEGNVHDTENTMNSDIYNAVVNPAASIPQIPTDTLLLTPPRSPSPTTAINLTDAELATRESSQLELLDDPSNRQFKTESVEESLNSYNDLELELKERLAETMEDNTPVSFQLSNAAQENDQSKPEAPVENNVVANDIGTTETNDDAPKSPPPAVPAEIIVPTFGPAITEDVASVTKAIEEIDINEKAVAAAVNENIESANTNEIIADMNHQNNMKE